MYSREVSALLKEARSKRDAAESSLDTAAVGANEMPPSKKPKATINEDFKFVAMSNQSRMKRM